MRNFRSLMYTTIYVTSSPRLIHSSHGEEFLAKYQKRPRRQTGQCRHWRPTCVTMALHHLWLHLGPCSSKFWFKVVTRQDKQRQLTHATSHNSDSLTMHDYSATCLLDTFIAVIVQAPLHSLFFVDVRAKYPLPNVTALFQMLGYTFVLVPCFQKPNQKNNQHF